MNRPETDGDDGPPGGLAPLPLRAGRVFVSPGRLADDLRERPEWVGAAILGAVLSVASVALIPGDLWRAMAEVQLQGAPLPVPGGELPEGWILRFVGIWGALVGWFVWLFFVAGACALVFRVLLGDGGTFRQYLALVAHAALIVAVGSLLVLPLRLMQEDPALSLSLGTFAVFLEDGYLYRALSRIDLFALWAYVVLGLGVSRVNASRGWGGAAVLLVGLWAAATALLALLPGSGP